MLPSCCTIGRGHIDLFLRNTFQPHIINSSLRSGELQIHNCGRSAIGAERPFLISINSNRPCRLSTSPTTYCLDSLPMLEFHRWRQSLLVQRLYNFSKTLAQPPLIQHNANQHPPPKKTKCDAKYILLFPLVFCCLHTKNYGDTESLYEFTGLVGE